MKIAVPQQFLPYVEPAIVRLQYLLPQYEFHAETESIRAELKEGEALSDAELRREIFHQLYRHKIYEDTLPIRRWLYRDE